MNRNFLRLSAALLCLFILLSLSSFSQEKVRTLTVNLKTGQEHKIEMASTPSSGYTWIVGSPYDTTLTRLVSSEYIPPADTANPAEPGIQAFTFRALSPGETTIRMALRKDYSRRVARAEDYRFIISK